MRHRNAATGFLALWASIVAAGVAQAAPDAIVNGSFDTNASGWVDPGALPGTVFGWSAFDSQQAPGSGSMYVWTNLSEAGLDGPWQCAPAAPGTWALTADTYVVFPAQPQYLEPYVAMSLDFFASEDCTGVESASQWAVSLRYFQVWELLSIRLDAPAGTRSARVRFWVGGTYDTWTDSASFDDVSLQLVPEPASGALGAAALVVLALARRRLHAVR